MCMRLIPLVFVIFVNVNVQAQMVEPIQGYHIEVTIHIAEDQETRTQGLMNKQSLRPNEGLLMVFNIPRQANIWAMGMLIDLDIAFLDHNHCITAIEPLEANPDLWQDKIKPSHLLQRRALHSRQAASYVLEMPMGWFKNHLIQTGDTLLWPKSTPINWILHLPQNRLIF